MQNFIVGEVIREISPDRGAIAYWRDAHGLVVARQDARNVMTRYAYDAAGRLTGKSYDTLPAFWQSFAWDQAQPGGIGRLSGIFQRGGAGPARLRIELRELRGQHTNYRIRSEQGQSPDNRAIHAYDNAQRQ